MARDGTTRDQLELDEPLVIRSVVLRSMIDFERLFAGFTTLRAISYVTSPEVLLDIFTEKNYSMMADRTKGAVCPRDRSRTWY